MLSLGRGGSYPDAMSSASTHRWFPLVVLLGLGLGCSPGTSSKDTAQVAPDTLQDSDTSPGPDTDPPDTDDTADPGPVDEDGDGYTSDIDCDDRDPLTNPGAAETWNAIDDDCDGRADANGHYSGTAQFSTTAIYEGVSYSFPLDCPAELDRDGPAILLTVSCTPDPTDEMAQRLLGETLTWTIETDAASQGSWTGQGTLSSSDGWDIWVDASLTFSEFTTVSASAARSTVSLSMTASAALAVD